jgi:hypothetical protein|tara:strand:+ start:1044 stop:1322 length:279 start_codon:yes stop_codon:yes gene_type:complete
MEAFETQPNIPPCEFGYDPDTARCIVTLPDNRVVELIDTTLTEPNNRDSYLRGFCPRAKAMDEVHLIEEFGKLSVKKVTIDGKVLFEAPTVH